MVEIPKLYPILDTGLLKSRGIDPLTAATELLDAGAGILQLRHKGEYTRDVMDLAEQIAAACRTASIPFVVNDRADIARMIPGSWLHLGQDDLSLSDAQLVTGPDTPIGISTHNERQLLDACATPASYLAIGPIFATTSKDDPDPVVGVEELALMRETADWVLAGRPLVAIGGITVENAPSVWKAGVTSVAMISGLIPAQYQPGSIGDRFSEWLAASVLS